MSPATAEYGSGIERALDATILESNPGSPVVKSPPGDSLIDKLRAVGESAGFDVHELLGQGGMGAVVRAMDRRLGRQVALKFLVMSQPLKDDSPFGLRREAEKMGQLVHENIVQVYSWHNVGRVAFFSMEYVEGESLRQRVRRPPEMKLRDVLRITLEAARGIAAAHARGIIHRDIKPENIMLSGDGRVVKVADFGIASTQEDRISQISSGKTNISGTLGFMAPEQARGELPTYSTDIYALTATMYYALAAVGPYGRHDDSKVLMDLNQMGQVVPLQYARKGLPQPVYKFVTKGLSKNPGGRFIDANHFLKELEQLLLKVEGGGKHTKSAQSFRRLLMTLAVPAALVAGLAAGGAGAYYVIQQNSVTRNQLVRELSPMLDRKERWLNAAYEQDPNNAALAVMIDDVQKARQSAQWRQIAEIIDEVDRYQAGDGESPGRAAP